jgi:flagellar basal-body rod protein FlgG
MLMQSPASGEPIVAAPFAEGMGRTVQGALESSNVNVVQELVDMIETQRAYEVSSKTITSVDEMMRYLAQNV